MMCLLKIIIDRISQIRNLISTTSQPIRAYHFKRQDHAQGMAVQSVV